MDKEIAEAFKKMDEALGTAFTEPVPPKPQKTSNIRINFTNRRWATFLKFIKCALQILLTGKTTLLVKKN